MRSTRSASSTPRRPRRSITSKRWSTRSMTAHSASPESWRTDILSAVQAMLSGRLVPNSLSGPSTVLGDPAGLLPWLVNSHCRRRRPRRPERRRRLPRPDVRTRTDAADRPRSALSTGARWPRRCAERAPTATAPSGHPLRAAHRCRRADRSRLRGPRRPTQQPVRIINNHCPFGDVAIDNPVICAVDRDMVKGMLKTLNGDTDPAIETSLPRGDQYCVTSF